MSYGKYLATLSERFLFVGASKEEIDFFSFFAKFNSLLILIFLGKFYGVS